MSSTQNEIKLSQQQLKQLEQRIKNEVNQQQQLQISTIIRFIANANLLDNDQLQQMQNKLKQLIQIISKTFIEPSIMQQFQNCNNLLNKHILQQMDYVVKSSAHTEITFTQNTVIPDVRSSLPQIQQVIIKSDNYYQSNANSKLNSLPSSSMQPFQQIPKNINYEQVQQSNKQIQADNQIEPQQRYMPTITPSNQQSNIPPQQLLKSDLIVLSNLSQQPPNHTNTVSNQLQDQNNILLKIQQQFSQIGSDNIQTNDSNQLLLQQLVQALLKQIQISNNFICSIINKDQSDQLEQAQKLIQIYQEAFEQQIKSSLSSQVDLQ